MPNLFDSKAQVWVNPVNCVGVMGAGLAKQFANRFPNMLQSYRYACLKHHSLEPGDILVSQQDNAPSMPEWVVCLATKNHWRNPSKIEWIDSGLQKLAVWSRDNKISSLAIPAIGCGLGGLNWKIVRPKIVETLGFIDNLEIYEPF